MRTNKQTRQIKDIRRWIVFFMIVLFLSGLTAIPLETELSFVSRIVPYNSNLGIWIDKVYQGIADTNAKYPFLAYGYDWLAFAHFVLAILFYGVYRDPIRNKWVTEFGMIACTLIIPFAFFAGQYRGIPIGWRLIDCSFGILGLVPLRVCMLKTLQLEREIKQEEEKARTEFLFI